MDKELNKLIEAEKAADKLEDKRAQEYLKPLLNGNVTEYLQDRLKELADEQ